jgi:hypothetical protein
MSASLPQTGAHTHFCAPAYLPARWSFSWRPLVLSGGLPAACTSGFQAPCQVPAGLHKMPPSARPAAHSPPACSQAFVTCVELTEAGDSKGRIVATNVFERQGGAWKLVHHHGSPMPPGMR